MEPTANNKLGANEKIQKIYLSECLTEKEKKRLLSELLQSELPQRVPSQTGEEEFNLAVGYLISLLIPPLGLFIAGYYLIHRRKVGLKAGVICLFLTFTSLLFVSLLLDYFLLSRP